MGFDPEKVGSESDKNMDIIGWEWKWAFGLPKNGDNEVFKPFKHQVSEYAIFRQLKMNEGDKHPELAAIWMISDAITYGMIPSGND